MKIQQLKYFINNQFFKVITPIIQFVYDNSSEITSLGQLQIIYNLIIKKINLTENVQLKFLFW